MTKKSIHDAIINGEMPEHIGIIMDGNGRWAKKWNLPRTAGHVKGAKTFRKIVKHCAELGIKCITVYAFSTENWKRPPEEIKAIMNLFDEYLVEALTDFKKENFIVKFIGDRSVLAPGLVDKMQNAEELTKNKTGTVLNIAINYGGQQEIISAVKKIAAQYAGGTISKDDITKELVDKYIYTPDFPQVDLIIRPSGEIRTSNFLIWQGAYAELFFDSILWPDYKKTDLEHAIYEYMKRNRRFGNV